MSEKEIVKVGTTPATLLELAVEKGADVDKLEKLMELKMRWEANEAKKAYVVAITAFKASPPKIGKDKTVSFGAGKTSYKHASLAHVTEIINIALSEHGLSASWTTSQNGEVTVTCKITHILGHSEETTLKAPADTSGSKNAIQAIGSTISYLQRYTLLSLTGLATSDMDDDAQGIAEYITEEQAFNINNLISEKKLDESKILKFARAESVDKILKSEHKRVLDAVMKAKVNK